MVPLILGHPVRGLLIPFRFCFPAGSLLPFLLQTFNIKLLFLYNGVLASIMGKGAIILIYIRIHTDLKNNRVQKKSVGKNTI